MLLRVSSLCVVLLAGPSLATFGATAVTPMLVRDIATSSDGSSSRLVADQLVSLGGRAVFFLQSDGFEETPRLQELWTTDGTESGTERLKSFPRDLFSLGGNGKVAFFAVRNEEIETFQLWRTDGTEAGTFELKVTLQNPGAAGSSTLYQDRLVFGGCTLSVGCEPWMSDGTAAGTRPLRDVVPGAASSRPHEFTAAGGRLYFLADDALGPALWASDGTGPGTQRVATLPPFSQGHDLTAAGNRIFFVDGAFFSPHTSLWTSDGTAAGTRTVPPFDRAGGNGLGIDALAGTFGDSLLFSAFDRARGHQLWRTDGTPHGTFRLTSYTAPRNTFAVPPVGAAVGGRFVFRGYDQRLWSTRGTRASTQPLAGCPDGCPALNFDLPRRVYDGLLFFAGFSSAGGQEPWATDGTAAGTRRLADLCPGDCSSGPQFLAVLLGRVFFSDNTRLWTTDGTAGGTVLLGDLGSTEALAAVGDRVVFTTVSTDSVPGLAVTDGTAQGTRHLDIHLDHGASSDPSGLVAFGNEIRFVNCGNFPSGLWTSDGTAGGTFQLTGIPTGCTPLVRLGDAVYFLSAETFDSPPQLGVWRNDGTTGGTTPVTQLPAGRTVVGLGTAGNRLVFFVEDAQDAQNGTPAGSELWTSDGTAVGTVKVADLHDVDPIPLATPPGGPPGEIFFQAVDDRPEDGDQLVALWHSDGTAAGTRRLVEFFPRDLRITGLTRFAGAVYFSASSSGLWRTDGTVAGTRLAVPDVITEIVPFAGSLFLHDLSARTLLRSDGTLAGTNFIADVGEDPFTAQPGPLLAAAGGALYFVSFDADHGSELWATDGTRAGSRLVADVAPGPGSSFPAALTAAGGLLYFTADDGERGRELWVTDGSGPGTRIGGDVAEGPPSSSPQQLTVAGDRLFFTADDGFTGRELWVLPLGPNKP